MKKLPFIFLGFLLSISSFAQSNYQEIIQRIKFIEKEEKVIKDRIDGGQDASLFSAQLKKFSDEKNSLLVRKKNIEQRTVKAKKTQKSVAKKANGPKVLLQLNLLESRLRKVEEENKRLKNRVGSMGSSTSYSSTKSSNNSFKFSGHFQMRTESSENRQGVQGVKQTGQTFSRFRADMTFMPNSNLSFVLSPQATKIFGGKENSNVTSGSTNHTEIDFYQAFISYNLLKNLNMKVGRQAMAYGDHLIIGSLPWANTARSFDALKFRYKLKKGWVDAFWSKISDNGDGTATSTSTLKDTDDKDLFGIYTSHKINTWLNPFDFYLLHQTDKTTTTYSEINTVGFRIKGSYKNFFYRTENGIQGGANLGDDAHQYNVEAGGKYKGHKLSLEYSVAGKNYVQLYPTAHKFLGFADVLGRRNIKHIGLHYKTGYSDWLKVALSYHDFKRNDTTVTARKLTGGTWGTSGKSDDIGSEVDLVFNFITKDSLKFQLGGAFFSPGQYLKEQSSNKDDTVKFLYGMIIAKF